MSPFSLEKASDSVLPHSKVPTYLLDPQTLAGRPLSEATEIFETDFEDDSSDFEENYLLKDSFNTDERRRSQTTISSYDEAPTPSPGRSRHDEFEIRFRPVEGPKGPHLFRSSQSSSEISFDYGLQMSPLLPKQPPPRTETAFSEDTVTPITKTRNEDFSIATALHEGFLDESDTLSKIRSWHTQQVIDWMYATGIDSCVIECFEMHDVDGALLLELQFEDLKELDIASFGKRHQIWNAICDLKGERPNISPQPTPFEDISRPCTSNPRRSPSQNRNICQSPIDGDETPIETSQGKKRRGRKPKNLDVITPAESVSIVAIEQLLPKPHKCAKGERCAKWRKQQRELKQLSEENGLGRFPISPMKGGRVFVHGDPGNATTAQNMIPNVRKQQQHAHDQFQDQYRLQSPADPFRPMSEAVPSIVASSDLLGPGQLPEFALHADVLEHLDKRDPQDNVRQFLNFQHVNSPVPPVDDPPLSPTPPAPQRSYSDPIERSASVPVRSDYGSMFPGQQYPAFPSLQPPQAPKQQLRDLPKLDIPRSASATTHAENEQLASATSICRSATASPAHVYRLGTPASEMDVPTTAFPIDPVGRGDSSQSVPPNMQYRPQHAGPAVTRSQSRAARRPSLGLPPVKEHEVLSPTDSHSSRPSLASHNSSSTASSSSNSSNNTSASHGCSPPKKPTQAQPPTRPRDPFHHSPTATKNFGYGPDCTHSGWMKKRSKTALLRKHEWNDTHCRLKGTQLAIHCNAHLNASLREPLINVDDYAIACSSLGSNSKLAAAMKAFNIRAGSGEKGVDPSAFAFQLVPNAPSSSSDRKEREKVNHAGGKDGAGKTHHFAVKTKDERIDWMRELMLAKAREQKGKGFEVEVNGVQA
ncbi:hypothetical protein KC315_g16397 [Hortaea werneckii]|nr:hypothetical protein KC315_g16397 [Hortaea werneckii]